MRWVFERLFARAGRRLEDLVTLRAAAVLARHSWLDGSRLDLFADLERSVDAVGTFAGAREARGYRAFCAYAQKIHETVEGPFLHTPEPSLRAVVAAQGFRGLVALARIDGTRTLWNALGDFFRDARLRQLFGRYATYAGSSPFLAPATLNVIAHVERSGVFYVEGGMYKLAEAMASVASSLGVEIRCESPVCEVLVRNGAAAGVKLASGEEIPADAVVVNADAAAVAQGLLGKDLRVPRGAHKLPRSLSAVTVAYCARAEGFPLLRHNVFFSNDYAAEFRDITHDRMPTAPTVYLCAQDREDLAETSTQPERLFVIVNAPACADRAPLTPMDSEACEQQTRAWLTRHGLTIDPLDKPLVTTPSDFNRLFPGMGGALYGSASHGWRSSLTRPTAYSGLPGMYLAGGSVHPGAGVPMATLSGMHASAKVCADLTSTGRWRLADMPGGTSTP